uniref:Uncharacterized protein n=1 Tax=Cacopsylla melanoneura TaxID=428564 RepID=A0A8D9BXS0_9HEMI
MAIVFFFVLCNKPKTPRWNCPVAGAMFFLVLILEQKDLSTIIPEKNSNACLYLVFVFFNVFFFRLFCLHFFLLKISKFSISFQMRRVVLFNPGLVVLFVLLTTS